MGQLSGWVALHYTASGYNIFQVHFEFGATEPKKLLSNIIIFSKEETLIWFRIYSTYHYFLVKHETAAATTLLAWNSFSIIIKNLFLLLKKCSVSFSPWLFSAKVAWKLLLTKDFFPLGHWKLFVKSQANNVCFSITCMI